MKRVFLASWLVLVPSVASAIPGVVVKRTAPDPRPRLRDGGARIIYLNRHGGTYTPGWPDDSAHNVSGVPDEVSTIPPFVPGDQNWNYFKGCVTSMFERWNIEVTDVDPGDVDHIEAVIGGEPNMVQQEGGTLGVAMMTLDCSIVERGVVYVFAERFGTDTQRMCEAAAQEIAHAVGLEHEFLCEDPMTYRDDCNVRRQFQDIDARCGEWSPRDCECTGSPTQNSVRTLFLKLGSSDLVAPTVTLLAPLDQASVLPGFLIQVDARDDKRVTKVDFHIDGEVAFTDGEAPYEFESPRDIGAGTHTIEVKVWDAGTNNATATATVTVVPECVTDADCAEGLACSDDRCATALGGACGAHVDCASGICGDTGEGKTCTQTCDPNDASSCPAGFTCPQGMGLTSNCVAGGEGGGCRIGKGGAQPWTFVAAAFLALALVVLRRRA